MTKDVKKAPKPAPPAEVIKGDSDGQFRGPEKTSPNPFGRTSANPTVISKDGYAGTDRIREDRENARELAKSNKKRSFGEGT